jgi:DNA (cytosine-5)-methyltransferase 1
MIYGSACSGIEAATVAWHPLGWRPAWFAEIDGYCKSLLKYRYPGVRNFGDFTTIRRKWLYERIGTTPIDLLVGGTPCQDFSIAGLRAGLDGARGNLTLEYLKLARRLRPPWLVWENVPGVLSIDGGRTFGTFLGGLAELGYGFAYRVLDAQYFGVPQRRRRVFVVGYLVDWRYPAAVLFERESMSGYPPPSRKAGQGFTRGVAVGPSGGSFTETACTLDTRCKDGAIRNQLGMPAFSPDVAMSLNAKGGTGRIDGESETLRSGCHGANPMVAQHVTGTLCASGAGSERPAGQANEADMVIPAGMAVRRLTPRECERLQGFPDDYTAIPHRGKPAADGPRYKALGNSMATPVMRWIGERIEQVDSLLRPDISPGDKGWRIA